MDRATSPILSPSFRPEGLAPCSSVSPGNWGKAEKATGGRVSSGPRVRIKLLPAPAQQGILFPGAPSSGLQNGGNASCGRSNSAPRGRNQDLVSGSVPLPSPPPSVKLQMCAVPGLTSAVLETHQLGEKADCACGRLGADHPCLPPPPPWVLTSLIGGRPGASMGGDRMALQVQKAQTCSFSRTFQRFLARILSAVTATD